MRGRATLESVPTTPMYTYVHTQHPAPRGHHHARKVLRGHRLQDAGTLHLDTHPGPGALHAWNRSVFRLAWGGPTYLAPSYGPRRPTTFLHPKQVQIDILETGRFDRSDVDEQADHPWKLKSRWGTAFSKEGFCGTLFGLFGLVWFVFRVLSFAFDVYVMACISGLILALDASMAARLTFADQRIPSPYYDRLRHALLQHHVQTGPQHPGPPTGRAPVRIRGTRCVLCVVCIKRCMLVPKSPGLPS